MFCLVTFAQNLEQVNKVSLSILMLLATIGMAAAQTVSFDSFLWGDKMGTLTATKKKGGDLVYYEVKASNSAKILGIQKNVETITTITIKGGLMVESYSKRVDNGKLKNFCSIKWDGTKYNIETEKGKSTYSSKISLVTMEFYFTEPKASNSYYYNPAAQAMVFTKTGGGVYEFKTNDGVKHKFIYKNGILDEIENSMDLATVKFRKSGS